MKRFSQKYFDNEIPNPRLFGYVSYKIPKTAEVIETEAPEQALSLVLDRICSNTPPITEEDEEALIASFRLADRFFGDIEPTDREMVMASLFFDLGWSFGHSLIDAHKKEAKALMTKGQKKGGESSPFLPYADIINKYLDQYQFNRTAFKNKDEVISAIEREINTNRPIPFSTFEGWWRRYKAGDPIFTALSNSDN